MATLNPASNDRLNASAVMGPTGREKSTAACRQRVIDDALVGREKFSPGGEK
jgi:hypothetical protein